MVCKGFIWACVLLDVLREKAEAGSVFAALPSAGGLSDESVLKRIGFHRANRVGGLKVGVQHGNSLIEGKTPEAVPGSKTEQKKPGEGDGKKEVAPGKQPAPGAGDIKEVQLGKEGTKEGDKDPAKQENEADDKEAEKNEGSTGGAPDDKKSGAEEKTALPAPGKCPKENTESGTPNNFGNCQCKTGFSCYDLHVKGDAKKLAEELSPEAGERIVNITKEDMATVRAGCSQFAETKTAQESKEAVTEISKTGFAHNCEGCTCMPEEKASESGSFQAPGSYAALLAAWMVAVWQQQAL